MKDGGCGCHLDPLIPDLTEAARPRTWKQAIEQNRNILKSSQSTQVVAAAGAANNAMSSTRVATLRACRARASAGAAFSRLRPIAPDLGPREIEAGIAARHRREAHRRIVRDA
ncbi:hypothetical protein [Bradyrhizobium pachyrhizi]|uniref:hypothetical protein n=1 Tax=Bradyrhizobium pachyrhizi TaxID=280333 RepID=UPI003D365120